MKLLDNQTKAIITAGLLRTTDVVFALGFCLEVVTVIYWRIFGHPSANQLLALLLVTVVYFEVWLVALMFRIGVMILKVRADVNLMPEAAARIAAQIRLSGAPSGTKV